MDEVIFSGAYNDFKLGVRFDLNGVEEKDVAYALDFISSHIEPYAFRFSGIDVAKIERFASPKGKGLQAVCAFLTEIPAGMIKKNLADALPKQELMSAAESYLFNQLLTKAGVAFRIGNLNSSLKPSEEKPEDVIAFIAKYKDWVSVKKLGLENVQDYEVSGILSGINHTVVTKIFDFAGVNKDEALADSIAKAKRKSYGNLLGALRELEPKLTGEPEDAFVVLKVFEKLGYKPYASPEMLTDAHPDIKPPKVKGRKPKG